jgi:hypothetical protein
MGSDWRRGRTHAIVMYAVQLPVLTPFVNNSEFRPVKNPLAVGGVRAHNPTPSCEQSTTPRPENAVRGTLDAHRVWGDAPMVHGYSEERRRI